MGRSSVAKGHGGQKRAFKVKLIGKGVNDYSGPYREVFTDAISEMMEFDFHGRGYDGSALLQGEQWTVNVFVDGISHVLSLELLLLRHELQDLFCRNPDVDVDLLKCVVEYKGYNENDSVILFFLEALRKMTNLDRKKILQLVWAQNRLPSKQSDFESPCRIQKDIGSSDNSLPSAGTCFVTPTLPNYSSKDVLREKLTFAMENVCTMDCMGTKD
jgi:HECT-domain (ubiquitin-transferase)